MAGPVKIREDATGKVRWADTTPKDPDGRTEAESYLDVGWSTVDDDTDQGPQLPNLSDPKQAWVDAATARGVDADGTKQDIIDRLS